MLVSNAVASALANLLVVAGVPFLVYALYLKWHDRRRFPDIARRAGLQLGEPRYIGYCAAFAIAAVAILVIWPPSLSLFVRAGSPQEPFRGLGMSGTAVAMALLYGVVQTGFSEELLFRGLIAGSLSRRLPVVWADLVQSFVFLIPHLFLLRIVPEMWSFLPFIFAAALWVGWVRIKSGSIVGPWLIHGSLNVTICISVAVRSAS
jgi:membrane protease YdiL (CAAX protease family)